MPKRTKILGIDPGTKFSGYSVISVSDKDVRWLHGGLFRDLLKTVDKNININSKPFIRDMRALLKDHKPDIVIMESFMARSTHQSNLGAPISVMIGIVLHICHRRGIDFRVCMPSTWKTKLGRDFKDIEELYDTTYPIKQRLPNHNLDSFFQALYASGDKCYSNLSTSNVETIKRKMKDFGSLRADIDYVNSLEKERLRLLREKKSRKRKKK